MGKLWNRLKAMIGSGSGRDAPAPASAVSTDATDQHWQAVYAARQAYYERHIGPFPEDILKLGDLFGVWPGGGLFVIPADKIAPGTWAYTTFGLSNPDMPTTVAPTNASTTRDELGRVVQTSATLTAKPRAEVPSGVAGYGYEILVLAKEKAEWPLWIMQWLAKAELVGDAGMLARMDKYKGLTVEQVQVGDADSVNLLIARAAAPLPTGNALPNGSMELLVATTITDAEMAWSKDHGRDALLEALKASGIGQFSDRERPTISAIQRGAVDSTAPHVSESQRTLVSGFMALPMDVSEWTAGDRNKIRHPDAFLYVECGLEDEEFAGQWNRIWGTQMPLVATAIDVDREPGFSTRFSIGGNALDVPYEARREDAFAMVVTLNQLIKPAMEIRWIHAGNGESDLAFLPLPASEWKKLETTYGLDEVQARFWDVPATLDEFIRRWDG
jgi:hypothetical protein